jgi:hypothetical protein
VDLPTYTNIWRIEKRLYKLYDFRLPMPLPVGQIAVFLAIAIPYIGLLAVLGLPFSHTLLWLYILPPGVLAWVTTRPVLESKKLPELVLSQARYLLEPRTWCRMAPLAEKDEITLTGRIWRRAAPLREAEPDPAAARSDPARPRAAPRPLALPARAAPRQIAAASASPAGTGSAPRWSATGAPARTDAARAAAPGVLGRSGLSLGRAGSGRAPAPRAPADDEAAARSARFGPAPRRPAAAGPVAAGQAVPGQAARDQAASARQPAWPHPAQREPGRAQAPQPSGTPSGVVRPSAIQPPVPPPVADRPPRRPVQPPQAARWEVSQPAQPAQPGPAQPRPAQPGPVQAGQAPGRPVPQRPQWPEHPATSQTGDQIQIVPGPAVSPPGVVPPASRPPAVAPEPAVARPHAAPPVRPPVGIIPPPSGWGAPAPAAAEPAAVSEARGTPKTAETPDQAEAPEVPGTAEGAPARPARPVVTVTGDAGGERPMRVVERALRSQPGRPEGWRDRVVVVPGGHRPGKPDQLQRDRARARLPVTGPRRIVVLGCTRGAGQTTTVLLSGDMLATLRDEAVAVLDLNPGRNSLAEQAAAIPGLVADPLAAPRLVGDDDWTAAGGLPGRTGPPAPGSGRPGAGAGLQVISGNSVAGSGDAGRIIDAVARRYRLTLADPAAGSVSRTLQVADQLLIVAPASAEAANALGMTFEWLDAHGYGRLATGAVTVLNGVSGPTAGHAERAANVANGRCRAIVQVPWDRHLKDIARDRMPYRGADRGAGSQHAPTIMAAPTEAPGPAQPPGSHAASLLSPALTHAYTALAGVLIAGLADAADAQADR